MNIETYFSGGDCKNKKDYRVRIMADPENNTYTEIKAGTRPFSVSYENMNSPFEPVCISTASIGLWFGDTIYDIFSPYAQGTVVELYNLTDSEVEWRGFLKPNLYNQQLMHCEDDIDIEASDCLASLQYMDYVALGDKLSIVSFKELLMFICNSARLDGFWIADTKKINSNLISTSLWDLKISEKNFFSSDISKPWKIYEVLEELCRYLGYTAIQYKSKLYLMDYAYWGSHGIMPGNYFPATDYEHPILENISSAATISQEHLRGAGTSLSFDTLYNKVYVRDSIYKTEDFIPDMFADDALTNRYGAMSEYREIEPVESIKVYFNPIPGYDMPNKYCPLYISKNGNQTSDADDSKYSYFRKLYDNENYHAIFRNDSGDTVSLTEEQLKTSAATRNYIGANIVDFMAVENDNGSFNYEPQANASWKRYLMICQRDYPGGSFYMSPADGSAYLDKFPSVYELNSGYTCPVIIDGEKSFLTLNCTGLWERYINHDYINPKWIDEAQLNAKELWAGFTTCIPKLFFVLAIGDKYWNGSAWVSERSGFAPDVERSTSTNKKKKEVSDFNNWNKPLKILNRVDWEEFGSYDGYKIPLDPSLDMDDEIKFEVHLPGRITNYRSTNPNRSLWAYDGINSYVWLSDLSLKLTTTNAEKSTEDVLYENEVEIDENSLNELQDITFRITTFPGEGCLSYSHVGYNGGFLDAIEDLALSSKAQNAEMNCIEKWVGQFSTGTKKMQFTTDLSFNMLQKVSEGIYGEDYVPVGLNIDYGEGSQQLSIMQIKSLSSGDTGSVLNVKRIDIGNIAASGGTATITVWSSKPWTVNTSPAYFISLDKNSGTGGNVPENVRCTFESNTTMQQRSVVLYFSDGSKSAEIPLIQSAKRNTIQILRYDTEEEIGMYPINDWISGPQGTDDLWVQVMDEWYEYNMPTYDADWVHVERGGYMNTYHITFDENQTNENLSAILTFANSHGGVGQLRVGMSPNNLIVLKTISPNGLVDWQGGTITIQVESDSPWTASTEYTSMGSFLTNTGPSGISQFSFVMAPNPEGQGTRHIYFTVQNSEGGSARTVNFTQDAYASPYGYFSYYDSWYTEYTTTTTKIGLSGGTATVYLHTNCDWIIPSSYMEGISYSPLTGTSGATEITITCQATNAAREMTVFPYEIQAQGYPIANSNVLWIRQTEE